MGIRPDTAGLKSSGGDKRQTFCKLCRSGIFEGQPRVWSRVPLGLVHIECRERQLAQVAEAVLAS